MSRVEVRRGPWGVWYVRCPNCMVEPVESWEAGMALAEVHLLEAHSEGLVVPELLALIERVTSHVHGLLVRHG